MSMWVKCNSHRARRSLFSLMGELDSYGRWPKGERPFGEYFEVDEKWREALGRIKGLTILSRKPADLFKRWSVRA